MSQAIYITDFALACALGETKRAAGLAMFAPAPATLTGSARLIDGRTTTVGRLPLRSAPLGGGSRTNDLVARLVEDLRPSLEVELARWGPRRMGCLIGTSTTGVDEATKSLMVKLGTGAWPRDFAFMRQELGDTAAFGARCAGVLGPTFSISTACTSGAKAMTAGARMIEAGLVDAVICGGADTVCELTLNGFAALESIAPGVCNPFSVHRCGINIGEGGALFLLSKTPGPFRLEGGGESSDAYHASAPDPSAAGAELAVRKALATSGRSTGAVDFVHLHGTATRLNDAMEAGLIDRVFGRSTPCASTKPLTGHTLGAAGAVQAALSLIALDRGAYPPHVWDGIPDPELAPIRLASPGERPDGSWEAILSLSFAFGGNNIALMLGRG